MYERIHNIFILESSSLTIIAYYRLRLRCTTRISMERHRCTKVAITWSQLKLKILYCSCTNGGYPIFWFTFPLDKLNRTQTLTRCLFVSEHREVTGLPRDRCVQKGGLGVGCGSSGVVTVEWLLFVRSTPRPFGGKYTTVQTFRKLNFRKVCY